jgi:isochorismate synthase EntC
MTPTSHAWNPIETSFGYRYRATIARPSWAGLLGQPVFPICLFSPKDSDAIYVGSGSHRTFMPSEMRFLETTDPMFLSMPYESSDGPSGVIPEYLVHITASATTLDIYSDHPMPAAVCDAAYQTLFSNQEDPIIRLAHQKDLPSHDDWVLAVLTAQREMEYGALEKIVLSRTSAFTRFSGQGGSGLYAGFAQQLTQNGYHYFYKNDAYTLMGHSPEALLRVRGEAVSVDVVAGTRLSGAQGSLLNSPKDLAEHAVVLAYVQRILSHYGPIQNSPRIEMDLGALTHLYQCVEVSVPMVYLGELIQALHPTPALCGFPKQTAKQLIADLEQSSRGWYGGVFGMSIGDTLDLAVTIRGLHLTEAACMAQVGAGIVAASDPIQEWHELNTKLQSVVAQLGDVSQGYPRFEKPADGQ